VGDFTIFPNPTSGKFILDTKIKGEFFVYNTLGGEIYQSKIKNQKSEIDLSAQPNGVYFLHVQSENGTTVKKLIINK
jgi:hypothetical protein